MSNFEQKQFCIWIWVNFKEEIFRLKAKYLYTVPPLPNTNSTGKGDSNTDPNNNSSKTEKKRFSIKHRGSTLFNLIQELDPIRITKLGWSSALKLVHRLQDRDILEYNMASKFAFPTFEKCKLGITTQRVHFW